MLRETDACMVVDQLLKDADPALGDYRGETVSIGPVQCQGAGPRLRGEAACPFVILTNGREHYFWDYGDRDACAILDMPTRSDLQTRANLKAHRKGTLGETCRRFRTL